MNENEKGHELNEVLNEKLAQVEELLVRKNIVEKFPRELRGAIHEKIESIRHGGLTQNLIKEFEELGALVRIITSAHEEKEGDDDLHQIFSAAVEGDIKVFRDIIKSGADIHSVLPDGTTLLMVATEHGQESIVDKLIKSGVDVNQVRQDSFSALLLACFAGYEGIAQSLLNAGADVNARYILRSSQGAVGNYTILMVAAIRGNLPLCKILLKHDTDIDAMNDAGNTPLMCSLTNGGNADVARFLLKAGANPDPDVVANVSFSTAFTPLILATMNEQTEIVKELINRKVQLDKPDGDGWTALKRAAKLGNIKIVDLLLKAGASVDAADHEGWTPLMNAAVEGHVEVGKLLVEAGANLDNLNNIDE